MTRARILADYVSSGDELALKAPLAGPTFTGTVAIPNVANLETAVVANTAKVTNANPTLADINALDVTELGTVTSGSIGSGVTIKSADYGYLLLKTPSAFTAGAAGNIIKPFASSGNRFTVRTGDTTNFIEGTSDTDLKIVKKGIYNIIFCVVGSAMGPEERYLMSEIRGEGAGSTNSLIKSYGHLSYIDSATSYANAICSYTGLFAANSQINFHVASGSDGNADIANSTHASITLIREVE